MIGSWLIHREEIIATGADAEISLDFMAGYAAFTPSRTLRRSERVLISFAGPAVQVLLGTAAYLLTRGALAWPEYGRPVQYAVLWAGPVIGLFNLLPVLPFDTGPGGDGVRVLNRFTADQGIDDAPLRLVVTCTP